MKYIQDSKQLVDQQAKIIKGIFLSDMAPRVQAAAVEGMQGILAKLSGEAGKVMNKAANNLKMVEEKLDF